MGQSSIFALNDSIIHAVARLVDDAGEPREPSHSDIEAIARRQGLIEGDPHQDPAVRVGKQKRVRHMLHWAMDNDPGAGEDFVGALISTVRGCGGFRLESPNYCGQDAIETCVQSFGTEPVELTTDGQLRQRNLEGLAGRELTDALRSYVLRAQRGHADSVLVSGTDKDLLEATAAHVLSERYGSYSVQSNFPTLLGQAFLSLGLHAQRPTPDPGGVEGAVGALNVALYELGCAVNRLRNQAGGGHGRPFLPALTSAQVRSATEATGLVAGALLDALEEP